MKILHIGGYYPVTKALAKGQTALGHEVKTACLSKPDSLFNVPPAMSQIIPHAEKLSEEGFDIVNVHRPESFLSARRTNDDMAGLLQLFKSKGSKLFYYTYGCDAGVSGAGNYQRGQTQELDLPQPSILQCFEHVFVGREDHRQAVSQFFSEDERRFSWLPLAIDTEAAYQIPTTGDDLKIVHVPNGTSYRDTDYVAISLAMLVRMGLGIEFEILDPREVSNIKKVTDSILSADIVVEQTTQNSYGLVGALGMTMGKIVISGNAQQQQNKESSMESCPVVTANLTTLTETILDLVRDKEKRKTLAEAGIKFAEDNHNLSRVGEKSLQAYQKFIS